MRQFLDLEERMIILLAKRDLAWFHSKRQCPKALYWWHQYDSVLRFMEGALFGLSNQIDFHQHVVERCES